MLLSILSLLPWRRLWMSGFGKLRLLWDVTLYDVVLFSLLEISLIALLYVRVALHNRTLWPYDLTDCLEWGLMLRSSNRTLWPYEQCYWVFWAFSPDDDCEWVVSGNYDYCEMWLCTMLCCFLYWKLVSLRCCTYGLHCTTGHFGHTTWLTGSWMGAEG